MLQDSYIDKLADRYYITVPKKQPQYLIPDNLLPNTSLATLSQI